MKSQSLPVPPGMVKKFRCAFFNFSAEVGNQTGGWSYRGVETHVINTTHVRCNASHLTSFAVLVSIVPSVGEPVSDDVWTAKLDRKCMSALLQYVLILLLRAYTTIYIYYIYTVHPVSISPPFPFHFSLLWTTSHTLVAAFLCCVCLPPLYFT